MHTLIPPHINVLALMATATNATRKAVIRRLSMNSQEIISITPDKPNLLYQVCKKPEELEAMAPLMEKLQAYELPTDHKIIILCHMYNECSQHYRLFTVV